MLRVHIRFLLTAAVAVGSLFAEEFVGKVVAITDGDTLKVLRAGTEVRVRLHGIDAPESLQPFGRRAQQFVGDLTFGKMVTIIVRDHDRYRRLVVEVILPDGRSLNHELVRSGLA
jgi:endonuclease YncB( thermonuclease family)